MKSNVSNLDRIIRVILGIALGALYFTSTITGIAGIIALVLGVVFLVTGIVGFCPLYALLKLSTKH
jgi:uncharacterized membrane protein HdeD (DUF308 family)